MELIIRYLQAVKLALPRAQQADVIKELSEELQSQVEEREASLGRPFTEDDQVALLKQWGHPLLLASRYRKQQYLISPAVFPIYWLVLRLVLIVVLFGMSVVAIVVAAVHQDLGSAFSILANYPVAATSAFAWITLVFAALEYFQASFNFYGKWDPRQLPKLSKREPKRTQLESIATLSLSAIFGIWWLVGLKHQFLIIGPGLVLFRFGPVFQTLYPLFVVAVLADLVRNTVAVLRPGWDKGHVLLQVMSRALSLVVLYFLINASELLVAEKAIPPNMLAIVSNLNLSLHYTFILIALITMGKLAWDVYRAWGSRAEKGERAAVAL